MLMPNSPPAPRTRDRSLDIVRVTALVFMVTAHWGRALQDSYHLVNILQFVFEVAPVLFFFAFGMTLEHFLRKPLARRIESHLKLFILAVVHSLYGQKTPLSSDFFMFLFAARLLFDIHSQINATNRVLVAAFVLALCGAWIVLPFSIAYDFFMPSFPGWFPVFPWILFVAAGRAYSRHRQDPRTAAVALFGLSLALFDVLVLGNRLSKWPLSPDYALLFASGTALAFIVLDRIRWPALLPWRTIELLSGNLLLATALHYVAVAVVTSTHHRLAPLLVTWVPERYLAPAFSLEYIVLAFAAALILIGLVRGAVATAGWLDSRGILGTLDGLFPAIAVVGIVLYAGSLHLDAGLRLAGLPLLCSLALLMVYKRT